MEIDFILLKLTRISFAICCFIYFLEATTSKTKWHDLMDWEVLQLRHPFFTRYFGTKNLQNTGFIKCTAWICVSCSLAVLLLDQQLLLIPSLLLILLGLIIFFTRSPYGMDGSDQVLFLLSVCLLFIYIKPTETIIKIAFTFISLQLVFSYFISGYGKLISKEWRNGQALIGVMGSEIYGNEMLYHFFKSSKLISIVVSWLIILFEIMFFTSFFLNPYVFISFLFAGILFHFSNAVFMGLNTFFLSFVTCYFPLILCYLSWSISGANNSDTIAQYLYKL